MQQTLHDGQSYQRQNKTPREIWHVVKHGVESGVFFGVEFGVIIGVLYGVDFKFNIVHL